MTIFFRFLVALAAIEFISQPVLAQEPGTNEEAAEQTESIARSSQSGYEDILEFGGPESVGAQLKENDAERESLYQFDGI